ncbi:hypothetical protein LX16_4955 [Stackebrandtia albiflava]|uniref:Uncharacterized protein n=1 Tax=Stackebrandtia albiflava TaxID=406432 RepID=A0A562UQ96_9ACTN|nr:hypothetical protein LX16_4955 [Stackebrandtia albiflava]
MDGSDRIRADAVTVGSRTAAPTETDRRPHFPDVIRGVTCQVCRTDWPCRVVLSRRPS